MTITPPPRCAIDRAAARVPKNVPSRWTASIVRHSASGSRTRASSGVVTTCAARALGELLLGARNDALRLRGRGDPGVVDPDVDGPERCLGLCERAVDVRSVAHVRPDGDAPAELRCEPRRVLVDVENGDASTIATEPQADRLADAGAASGDDRNFPLEAHGTTTARPAISPFSSRR